MAHNSKWLPVACIVFLMTLMPFTMFGKEMADKFQKLS